LIAAELSAAEDHIWALREDPAYFKAYLLEYKEHRMEMLKDYDGREHTLLRPRQEEALWQRIIPDIVGVSNFAVEVWFELLVQIQGLGHLQARYAHEILPDQNLPAEYLHAILRLRFYLERASRILLVQLKEAGSASPPLRSRFARRAPSGTISTPFDIVRKPSTKLSQVETELLWLLELLWADREELAWAGLSETVDELQRLLRSDGEAKNLISAHVLTYIGALAVISETLKQLNMYQPWAHLFDRQFMDQQEEISGEFFENTKPWRALATVVDGPDQMRIARLRMPTATSFYYPVDKPLNKKHSDAMRAAERNLDDFWVAVDHNMTLICGSLLDGTAIKKLLSQPRALRRTQKWIDQPQALEASRPNGHVAPLLKPLSELYFDLEYRTSHTVDASPKQVPIIKEKTRGNARSQGQDEGMPAAVSPSNSLDARRTFHVDARALKVFRTLFYIPSQHSTPGEIAWTDFLHAMVTVGFTPEKLYGSVWHFHPTRLDVERSIHFHEPHPQAKLAYRIARRFGRRLERAFGWVGGMFELATTNGANLKGNDSSWTPDAEKIPELPVRKADRG